MCSEPSCFTVDGTLRLLNYFCLEASPVYVQRGYFLKARTIGQFTIRILFRILSTALYYSVFSMGRMREMSLTLFYCIQTVCYDYLHFLS